MWYTYAKRGLYAKRCQRRVAPSQHTTYIYLTGILQVPWLQNCQPSSEIYTLWHISHLARTNFIRTCFEYGFPLFYTHGFCVRIVRSMKWRGDKFIHIHIAQTTKVRPKVDNMSRSVQFSQTTKFGHVIVRHTDFLLFSFDLNLFLANRLRIRKFR